MRIPRCYVDIDLNAGQPIVLPERAARHLAQVLRLRSGDKATLFNGRNGRDYPATLQQVNKRQVTADIGQPDEAIDEPPLTIQLNIGISKGERMDFAIQKAVELGVSEITPLFTERSVVRLTAERLAKRMEHWQGVIIGACEQCGRRYLPKLNPASNFEEWSTRPHEKTLLLDHRAESTLPELPPPENTIGLLIGPEGGLSPAERELASATGCRAIRMGTRVMRTETAPLAAIAAIQTLWGDFR